MTPKEKAKELVDKFYNLIPRQGDFKQNWEVAKEQSVICVDEIMKSCEYELACEDRAFDPDYWNEVKKEIEKL